MTERYSEEPNREVEANKLTSMPKEPNREDLADGLSNLDIGKESVQEEVDQLSEEIKNLPPVLKFKSTDEVLAAYKVKSDFDWRENYKEKPMERKPIRRWISGMAAGFMLWATGGELVKPANAEEKSTKTKTVQFGTMPSQEIGSGSGSVEITPAPPEGSDWFLMTEVQQEALKKQIAESLTSPTPTPLPEVSPQTVWDIINESENAELQQYRDEALARGVEKGSWSESCAKVMRVYDLSKPILEEDGIPKTKGENSWQTNITRDQLFEIFLKKDKSKFALDSEGNPDILIIQNKVVDKNNKIGKAFNVMIDRYKKNGVSDIVNILSDNGMCVFCPITFDERGALTATYNEYGGCYINITKGRLKEVSSDSLVNILERFAYAESLGISNTRFRLIHGMGVDWFLEEATKRVLAGEACKDMYLKTGTKRFLDLSDVYFAGAQDAANKVNLSLNSTDLQSNIRFIKINNLARSLSPDGWKLETASN